MCGVGVQLILATKSPDDHTAAPSVITDENLQLMFHMQEKVWWRTLHCPYVHMVTIIWDSVTLICKMEPFCSRNVAGLYVLSAGRCVCRKQWSWLKFYHWFLSRLITCEEITQANWSLSRIFVWSLLERHVQLKVSYRCLLYFLCPDMRSLGCRRYWLINYYI